MSIYGVICHCGNPKLPKRKGCSKSCSIKAVWANRTPEREAEIRGKAGKTNSDRIAVLSPEEKKKRFDINPNRAKNLQSSYGKPKSAYWCAQLSARNIAAIDNGTWKNPNGSYTDHMKGVFKPKNNKKYKGNPTRIVFRSSWELKMMRWLDADKRIEWWQSEEVVVPYKSPADGRYHRYFVDFVCKTVTGDTLMIEVKPLSQCSPPLLAEGKRMTASYKKAVITYGINQAKWAAARAYCAARGWEFVVMTEKDLGIK